MATRYVLALAAILLAGSFIAAPQGSGNDLFQQALVKERAEGDLKQAIQLYQQIVEKYGANRPLAAKALLQMGLCYEKLGQADARQTYERLVKEYSDQADVVAEARGRLAALTTATAKPKFTKIRTVGLPADRLTTFELSPDGQQLAYVSGGSVWLLPVHGPSDPAIAGQPHRVTEPNPIWFRTYDVAWSRNGKWLALWVEEHPPQGDADWVTYVVPAAGGKPQRVSLERPFGSGFVSDSRIALSHDGERLAYGGRDRDGERFPGSIYLQPALGGPAKRLVSPASTQILASPQFSPDGKRIAYVARVQDPGRRNPLGRQVWVADVAGGAEQLVYDAGAPALLRSPVWSPDGNMLAFLLNPRGSTEACEILVLASIGPDGRPVGAATQIELPYYSLYKLTGWGADNKIGLVLEAPELQALYTVPAAGGKAVQLTPKTAWMPSWTPDGARIYFSGLHHGEFARLEYVSSAGGPVGEIPVKDSSASPAYPSSLTVSPDGKKVLFPCGKSGICTIPTEGGAVSELATGMGFAYDPQWSPDGKQIAFVSNEFKLYVMPAEGGQPRMLTAEAGVVERAQIAWSPDGKHLAYQTNDGKIRLLPLDGGPSRVLVEGLTTYRVHSGLAWSPDGKELAYATGGRIWRLNLATGRSERLETGVDATHMQIAWSPDGRTIAFNALQGGEPELWLMEDFLPLVQARR